jgi:lipoyl(octanoyl) transferase
MNVAYKNLGMIGYVPCFSAMRRFTVSRSGETEDEFWFVEHSPVFTLGKSGKLEDVFDPGQIPIVNTDRGGQVTYHGPGQSIVYTLLDLRRLKVGPRELVRRIERGVVKTLKHFGLGGDFVDGAPGVYLYGRKIASLGLRLKNGCTYHGVALNVSNDLEPFSRINPCGVPDLPVTRLSDHVNDLDATEVRDVLGRKLFASIYDDTYRGARSLEPDRCE